MMSVYVRTGVGGIVHLLIVENSDRTGKPAAALLRDVIVAGGTKGASICFATGSSPLPAYQELVAMHKSEAFPVEATRAYLLDEYVGLSADHPQSFGRFMAEHLYDPIGLPQDRRHRPGVESSDLDAACKAYETALKEDRLDLAVLGIGANGHIAFNEPGTPRHSRTRVVDLTDDTRHANARFFDKEEKVPHQAVTVGISTILDARRLLLLASGENKAAILAQALQGGISTNVPASYLQVFRGELTVIADEAACRKLAFDNE
ncbi:glucosamine-6-phosphate deaminase [bacterium]|nr:glucosamine-6-phosphate deaminase [bacterium]MCB9476398.1 glucosamine-6-phosphate deaminase [Deltaproteobacteria bacterium]MCB9478373.1 glucosamine-6-phosphate deaminase [Deltaproteobacteria bacterium]